MATRPGFRLRSSSKILVLAGAFVLTAGPCAAPAGAAGKALATPGDAPAPEIHLVRRLTPELRAKREREEALRRERARPAVVAWTRAYLPAVAPVRAALHEALASLAFGRGPAARNVAYPLEVALADFRARVLLPAPDAELDLRLDRALMYLRGGAEACRRGQPTVAQLRLYQGQRWLELAEEVLHAYARPPRPGEGGRIRRASEGRTSGKTRD